MFSSDIKWSHHYECIITIALKTIYSDLSEMLFALLFTPLEAKSHDITLLECVQRRATKFILIDYSSSYKSHLVKLGTCMLPLMYAYEIADIMYFIS